MKRPLCILGLIAVTACLVSLALAAGTKADKSTYRYTGGIEGRVKHVINPPLLTGAAKLMWNPKKRQGSLDLVMAGGHMACDVTSSDGKSFKGNMSCTFTGYKATGPVTGTLTEPDSSGIPQKMQGSFDITIPEQGNAEYVGTFNGSIRSW